MKKNKHVQKRLFPVLVILIALNSGCAAVGPNYTTPEISLTNKWHTELKDGLTVKQTSLAELESWWKALNDPVLSDLVGNAIAHNLDLKQARSRVRQARANRAIAGADLYPTVDATGSYNKSRSSKDAGGGNESDLYSAGLDADWELDIFGGVRRNVEAAQGDLEASREDLRDVLVSLVAEVGLNYVDVRTYQARLAVAEKNLATQLETYQLTKCRNMAGLETELAVQQARYNAESTRSQIPSLRTGLEEALNRIAVLLGEQPGAIHESLAQPKSIPVPPLETAVGVPADILRQRPDVRRSERELAAQTARVGAAVADLYPRFTLSGSIGLDALTFSGLFSGRNRSMSFGPNISFPVFNAGSIRSNIEVQSALQEEALSAYELSVLNALEEVENALVAYAQEQDRRRSLIEAADAARQAAALAEDQYNAGLSDFDSVLDAQRSLLTFQDELAESDGTVTSNLIRLYKALGCLDIPSSGKFLFDGVDVADLTRDQRALLRRHYLGFVFQGFNLLGRTSALENVELPLIYRGAGDSERKSSALEALEAVGLKEWESHTPGELSGGQQQRVAIARAIASKPRLLLADEPTGNLDSQRSREAMDLLTAFNRERGITIVMVTHEPDMAEYAGRQILFRDGLID